MPKGDKEMEAPPENICLDCGATDAISWMCKRCAMATLNKWRKEGVWSRELPNNGS